MKVNFFGYVISIGKTAVEPPPPTPIDVRREQLLQAEHKRLISLIEAEKHEVIAAEWRLAVDMYDERIERLRGELQAEPQSGVSVTAVANAHKRAQCAVGSFTWGGAVEPREALVGEPV